MIGLVNNQGTFLKENESNHGDDVRVRAYLKSLALQVQLENAKKTKYKAHAHAIIYAFCLPFHAPVERSVILGH